MPLYVPQAFASRSWALPVPSPDLGRSARLQRAVRERVVLVTGASSGIGEAVARQLAEAGARVLLVARSADALGGLARELGGGADAHPTDLTDGDAVERLVETVLERHGHVDVLVNNAGHSIRRTVSRSTDRLHDYERTMALNYFGPLRLILGLLPSMRERRRGQIVNVSSMGVQLGAPRFSAYLASKSALDAFTRVLAGEVEPHGIRCTTVHMPLVRTPMIAPTRFYDRVPALSPESAADMVCEAIRSRPARLDFPLGTVGEVVDAIAPGLLTRAIGLASRVAR